MTAEPWDAEALLGLLRDIVQHALDGDPVDWAGPELTSARLLSISPSVSALLADPTDPLAAVIRAAWLLGIEQGFRILAREGDFYDVIWQAYMSKEPMLSDVAALLARRLRDPGGVRR